MFSTWKNGPEMSAVQSPQQGALSAGPGGWHPTILYMLGLVIAEIVIVAWLSRRLLG
jgi:hypothetical protein